MLRNSTIFKKYEEVLRKMKHFARVSGARPDSANKTDDVVCMTAHVINGIVTAKGGTAPIASYMDTKCDFPPTS